MLPMVYAFLLSGLLALASLYGVAISTTAEEVQMFSTMAIFGSILMFTCLYYYIRETNRVDPVPTRRHR